MCNEQEPEQLKPELREPVTDGCCHSDLIESILSFIKRVLYSWRLIAIVLFFILLPCLALKAFGDEVVQEPLRAGTNEATSSVRPLNIYCNPCPDPASAQRIQIHKIITRKSEPATLSQNVYVQHAPFSNSSSGCKVTLQLQQEKKDTILTTTEKIKFVLSWLTFSLLVLAVLTLFQTIRQNYWNRFQKLQEYIEKYPFLYDIWYESKDFNANDWLNRVTSNRTDKMVEVIILIFLEMWADSALQLQGWSILMGNYTIELSSPAKAVAKELKLMGRAGYGHTASRRLGIL